MSTLSGEAGNTLDGPGVLKFFCGAANCDDHAACTQKLDGNGTTDALPCAGDKRCSIQVMRIHCGLPFIWCSPDYCAAGSVLQGLEILS